MTVLLEFREKIKLIYSKNEVFILPIVKFLFALFTLNTINGQMGYMARLDNMALVLIVALFCSFMPNGCLIFFAAAFSLLHMYTLSLEVAVVGLAIYMLLYVLLMRFASKNTLAVIVTPLLCGMNMPYVVPVAMGLIGTPSSAVSVSCGVVVYYLLQTVKINATTIGAMASEDVTAKFRLLIDALMDNKAMLVMIAAFAITVIVVYLIRRMSVDFSWTIAIIAGVMVDLVILLIGDLIYDTNMSVVNAMLGALLAVIVAKVIEFFRFCVDYSRTEKVQFEDDEYYYYVKAIPKMTVAAPTKTVKKINSQRKNEIAVKGSSQGRNALSERSVITERTTSYRNRNAAHSGKESQNYYRDRVSSGRSVTINSNQMQNDDMAEFEDIF